MEMIKLAAGWDGSPFGLRSPNEIWIYFLEVRGVAYAAYLDEPPGWRLVVVDELRFMQAMPALRKYGIYGVHEWKYDIIHP